MEIPSTYIHTYVILNLFYLHSSAEAVLKNLLVFFFFLNSITMNGGCTCQAPKKKKEIKEKKTIKSRQVKLFTLLRNQNDIH